MCLEAVNFPTQKNTMMFPFHHLMIITLDDVRTPKRFGVTD